MPKTRVLEQWLALSILIAANLVSVRAWFIAIPFSLIAVLSSVPKITNSSALLSWALIALISHLSMLPFVLYAEQGRERWKQGVIALSMGLVRGGLIGLLAPIYGLSDSESLPTRMVASSITVFYWFQFIAIFLEVRSSFVTDLRRTVRKTISEKLAERNTSLAERFKKDDSRIDLLVSRLQEEIAASPLLSEGVDRHIEQIDTVLEAYVRPQSKLQWKRGELIWPKVGLIRILDISLRERVMPVISVVIVTAPLSLSGQISRLGFILGLVVFLLSTAIGVASYLLIPRLVPAPNGDNRLRNLFLLISFFAVSQPILYLLISRWPFQQLHSDSTRFIIHLISYLFFVGLCLLATVVLTIKTRKHDFLEIIEGSINAQKIDSFVDQGLQAVTDAEYAQYLHAEVQSRLVACKLILMKAASSDFKNIPPEVVATVLERLEEIKEPYVRQAERLARNRLVEISALWKGLASITYELPDELDHPSVYSEVIAQLIEESVVNAIRHGKARHIEVKATLVDAHVRVVITDDGTFSEVTGSSGLGTILFETFAEEWEIVPGPEGTTLIFKVLIE